jgi:Leucine-rich repeat (LRR) protein
MEMLPEIQTLEELDIQENGIESVPKDICKNFPKLTVLRLSHNKIKNVADLQGLKGCTELRVLNLDGNPVTKQDNYEKRIRELLPNLDLLDCKDKDGQTVDSGEDGKYSKASGKEDSSDGSDYHSDNSDTKMSRRTNKKKDQEDQEMR